MNMNDSSGFVGILFKFGCSLISQPTVSTYHVCAYYHSYWSVLTHGTSLYISYSNTVILKPCVQYHW